MTFPPLSLAGIPAEFILFGATLAGVVLFHRYTLAVAVGGLAAIAVFKLLFADFAGVTGFTGLLLHLRREWVTVANLGGLLLGFALLSRHFEESRVPAILPRFLPDDWKGGFALLGVVFVMSSFLDNIAAAMIGGTMATTLFRGRLHIGYIAAIVAASNAGGAGSVVGDTTTTMMWIAGVPPRQVFEAYVAALPALLFFGVVASRQQHALQPIERDATPGVRVEWARLAIVGFILVAAIGANVGFNLWQPAVLGNWPVIGLAVWLAIAATAAWRRPDWRVLPEAARGSVFLLALVLCASMMPVERLPAASWPATLGLGFVSAVFDNIPLTALALRQGGYDWGFLAYAVGFGGSMIWFGSSAGVALASMFPEARSVGAWLQGGWHILVGYLIGFAVLLASFGWHPDPAAQRAARPATPTIGAPDGG